jgi:hypothetical protein
MTHKTFIVYTKTESTHTVTVDIIHIDRYGLYYTYSAALTLLL